MYFGGVAKNRHVADLTTVLYAVRGLGDFWDIEDQGAMDLKPNMTFEWKYDMDRNHAYLLKKLSDRAASHEHVEQAISDLLLASPAVEQAPRREGQRQR